ncbi:hypothetical protein [Bradyrhizobium sp. CCBAU 11434]|nr:hypothetical protein [Bradyrhizobium sp. CCBAU 11434]
MLFMRVIRRAAAPRFLAVLAKLPLQIDGLIGIVGTLQQGAAFIT